MDIDAAVMAVLRSLWLWIPVGVLCWVGQLVAPMPVFEYGMFTATLGFFYGVGYRAGMRDQSQRPKGAGGAPISARSNRMTERDLPLSDRVAADMDDAAEGLLEATRIEKARHATPREHRREFLMQEAELEAQLLENEGYPALAAQLRAVARELRVLQPKVVATGQGEI